MSKILDVENLQISFSDHGKKLLIVKGISFNLHEGECIALVGESGSGKSIIAKSILGLLPKEISKIECGKIIYKGKDLTLLSEKELRVYRGKEIGIIFQNPFSSFNPTMKVGKQIEENIINRFAKTTKKEAYEKTIELFKLVGISGPEKRYSLYPHELSGGMLQRIMIAQILSTKPKILIADEPTTALDVTVQAQILELIKKIQNQLKMSVIFITHNLSLVSNFCSRVLVLYEGMIVESDHTKKIFYQPKDPYTIGLIKCIPKIDH